jgi:negative regulator of replication initiation
MKYFALFIAFASVVAISSANDIKRRLMEFRSMDNVKKEKVVQFISKRHERRAEKLEEMLVQRRQLMDDHNTGRSLLSGEDHERVTRQLYNFERKLNQLKSMSEEERAEMYDAEAESLYKLNSIDYLDFNA